MDQFWKMAKIKINISFLFYRVVWTINALLIVLSGNASFSGNNQNIKLFGVPPNTLHIGYVHVHMCIYLPLGNSAFKQLQEGLMVFSDDFLHFLKIKKNLVEFTKTILWL